VPGAILDGYGHDDDIDRNGDPGWRTLLRRRLLALRCSRRRRVLFGRLRAKFCEGYS